MSLEEYTMESGVMAFTDGMGKLLTGRVYCYLSSIIKVNGYAIYLFGRMVSDGI